MTGPTESLPWRLWRPEGLAVLRGCGRPSQAAVIGFSGPEAVGDYLGVSYEMATPPPTGSSRICPLPGMAMGRRGGEAIQCGPCHDQRGGAGQGLPHWVP